MAKKKNTQKSTKATEFDLAIKVSDRVELESIRQLEGVFRLEDLNSEGKKYFTVVPETKVKVDKKNNKIFCFVGFSINTFFEHKQEQKKLACFESRYVLVYNIKSVEGLTAKNFDAFVKFNGVFNAWPYLREFMQTSTSRLSLPPLILPTYRYGMEFSKPTLSTTTKKTGRKKISTT